MDRLQAMRVFVTVAEAGGFAAAARTLAMSPPAVTRAVAGLEQAVGARLLLRSTRKVSLTEAGSRYLEDCRRILAEVAEAEAAAAGSYARPTGSLTVTAPVLFGQLHVLPVLLDYLDRYPEVAGRLLLLDRVAGLLEEGIDVAVRIGHLPDSSQRALRVGTVRRVVCGAPAYLERAGVPREPRDLLDHRIVAPIGSSVAPDWRFGSGPLRSLTLAPGLVCNSNAAVIDAAVAGWGLTRALGYQVAAELAAGRLRVVLEDFEEPPIPIHLVHAEGSRTSAKVRAFVDLAAERLRVMAW